MIKTRNLWIDSEIKNIKFVTQVPYTLLMVSIWIFEFELLYELVASEPFT